MSYAVVINAQISNLPCYSVSGDNTTPNVLFVYDNVSSQWNEVGATGVSNIDAIATDPLNDIIYAVDAGFFGIIDSNTGLFTAISTVGMALVGDMGSIALDDIDGLTYDPVEGIMFAVHRVDGAGPGTNDLLFQIDVSTGAFIPGAMKDGNGVPADYAVIEEVFDANITGDAYDVEDIAFNPYSRELVAIQNQDGPGTVTLIDPITGESDRIYDLPNYDIEGLGFNSLGKLFGTTGLDGTSQGDDNIFLSIDATGNGATLLNVIDTSPPFEVDFESFDCLTGFNDLALRMTVDSNSPTNPVSGDNVTFLIEVINQGDIDNYDIEIFNYIPTGLVLNDLAWADLGFNNARNTIPGPLTPGSSIVVPITFTVDFTLSGTTITNTAEISNSKNPNFTNLFGNLIILKDGDSKADNQNNEANVQDNEVNGKGPKNNEDEDDHDIATITLDSFLDLALTTKVSSSQSFPILPGDNVTFTISVINQGTVGAQNLTIGNYINNGFTFDAALNPSWISFASTALNLVSTVLLPGDMLNLDIILTVDQNQTTGSTLVNEAEIVSSGGNGLSDIDSSADLNQGNDAGGAPGSMADDVVIGDGTGTPGGTDPTTDEDDHDPEEITLGAAAPVCPAILNFTNAITHSVNEVFDASEQINSSATVSPTNVVTYNAGDTIFLDNGFSANPINAGSSSFTAKIEDCN